MTLPILCTKTGTVVCNGYTRIVVGDYGAFIEFDKEQANFDKYIIAPGQEYRVNDPKYSKNVKYIWMTIADGSNIKIYKQKKKWLMQIIKVECFILVHMNV